MYILLYLDADQQPAMIQANNIDELNAQIVREFPEYIAEFGDFEDVTAGMSLFVRNMTTGRFDAMPFRVKWCPYIGYGL